jgi:regulatory subunit for Cdc7p protein kinase
MSVRTAPGQRIHGVPAPSRAPLRDAPSAVLNSPLRGASTAVVGSKRARHESTDLRDPTYENGPHAKKMAALFDETAQRRAAAQNPRRVDVARPRPRPQQEQAAEAVKQQTAEAVKQWQRHYRKVFPTMVFYFESVSRDQMYKLSGQVKALGAVRQKSFAVYADRSSSRRPSSPKA